MKNQKLKSNLTLGYENEVKGRSKKEKNFFSPVLVNGENNLYFNIESGTPENQPSLITIGDSNYLNIGYNETFQKIINGLIESLDPEFVFDLEKKYLLKKIINNFNLNGYIRCKIDYKKFKNNNFFYNLTKDKKSTPLSLVDIDFFYDRINNASYILKIINFWRKTVKGVTVDSGIGIKVLRVIIKDYELYEEEDEEETEEKIIKFLEEGIKNL